MPKTYNGNWEKLSEMTKDDFNDIFYNNNFTLKIEIVANKLNQKNIINEFYNFYIFLKILFLLNNIFSLYVL